MKSQNNYLVLIVFLFLFGILLFSGVYLFSDSLHSLSQKAIGNTNHVSINYSFDCHSRNLTVITEDNGELLDGVLIKLLPTNNEKMSQNGGAFFIIGKEGTYILTGEKSGYYSSDTVPLNLEFCEEPEIIVEDENNQTEEEQTNEEEEEQEEPEEEPTCGEYKLGETWTTDDGCNTCSCTCEFVGEEAQPSCVCTQRYCPSEDNSLYLYLIGGIIVVALVLIVGYFVIKKKNTQN